MVLAFVVVELAGLAELVEFIMLHIEVSHVHTVEFSMQCGGPSRNQ